MVSFVGRLCITQGVSFIGYSTVFMQKELRPIKKMGKFTILDRERAQRKKEYLLRQEKKILAKRHMVELNEMKKNMMKRMELERRHLQRVKDELEKNSKAEKANMKHLQREHKVCYSAQVLFFM